MADTLYRVLVTAAADDECRECDCEGEMPYDPNDPGAYPGPDEDCECECHHG